jgi:hypothetical protein
VNDLSTTESIVVEAAESYAPSVSADWTALGAVPATQDAALNSLAAVAAAAGSASGASWAKATYDFSVNGGTIGTKNLLVTIPDAALILYAFYKVEVAPDSTDDLGTLTFILPTDGALTAAIPADGTEVSGNGIPDFDAANAVDTTAARQVSAVVATSALTAGKVSIYLFYVT